MPALMATLDSGQNVFVSGAVFRPLLLSKNDLRKVPRAAPAKASSEIEPLRFVKHPTQRHLALLEAQASTPCGHGQWGRELFGALRIFDRRAKLVHEQHFEESRGAIAYAPSGKILVVAGRDLALLETRGYRLIHKTLVQTPLSWVGFVDDELLVGLAGKKLLLWTLSESKPGKPVPTACGQIKLPIDFSDQGPLASDDFVARDRVCAIDLAPDGSALAVGVGDRVYLFSIER